MLTNDDSTPLHVVPVAKRHDHAPEHCICWSLGSAAIATCDGDCHLHDYAVPVDPAEATICEGCE